jgi:hypothetical protein
MSPAALKGVGSGCFVLCAILLFVAWERYQDNANKVEAANKMLGEKLTGVIRAVTGEPEPEPGMPTASKYALFLAGLAAVGGVVCFVLSARKGPGAASRGTLPPA